jgi:putative transposase
MNLPRSTCYDRPTAKTEGLPDAKRASIIEHIQDELPCYGYRRVIHQFRRHGLVINRKRVARVMRLAGLGTKPRRRVVPTTDSRHDSPIFPNVYCNNVPDHPDRVWVAGFTSIRVSTGFCFRAVILDACRRKVIGYALPKRLDTPLARVALCVAVTNRAPPAGCIHPTDRGCRGQPLARVHQAGLQRRKTARSPRIPTPGESETQFARKAA